MANFAVQSYKESVMYDRLQYEGEHIYLQHNCYAKRKCFCLNCLAYAPNVTGWGDLDLPDFAINSPAYVADFPVLSQEHQRDNKSAKTKDIEGVTWAEVLCRPKRKTECDYQPNNSPTVGEQKRASTLGEARPRGKKNEEGSKKTKRRETSWQKFSMHSCMHLSKSQVTYRRKVSEKTGLQSVHPKATQICSSPSLFRSRNRYEPLKLDEDLTASDISTGASLCSYKNSSRMPKKMRKKRFTKTNLGKGKKSKRQNYRNKEGSPARDSLKSEKTSECPETSAAASVITQSELEDDKGSQQTLDDESDPSLLSKIQRAWRNLRYRQRSKGKEAIAKAKVRYRAKQSGKDSRKKENSNYGKSPSGVKRRKAAIRSYHSSPGGKEALAEAKSKYHGTPNGKEVLSEATSKYQGTPSGKSVTEKAKKAYRQKPEFMQRKKEYESSNKEKLSQSRRERYRRRNLFEDLNGEDDSDWEDDNQVSTKRKEALEKIREHTVRHGKKMKFQENKTVIFSSRQSVYLPKLPGISQSSIFRTKGFMKSKTKVQWKNAAIQIFRNCLNEEMTTQIMRKKYRKMKLRNKSISFQKLLAAKHLQQRVLNARDLWIKVLYGRCHKLNITAEKYLNEEFLDYSEDKHYDSVLGWKSHRKGSEPYFPLYSFWNGQPFKFKFSKKDKKSREELREAEKCTTNCILAEGSEVSKFKNLLEELKDLDVRNTRSFAHHINKCGNVEENEMYSLIVEKRNHPEGCFRREEKNKCTSNLVLLRKLAVHYNNVRYIYKMANDMKIANQFVSDIDTATAIGDIEYLLKLLEYEPLVAAKTFDVERPDQVVNEEFMKETFGEHYLEFLHSTNTNPNISCVSCQKLIEDDPKKCKTITSRWKKVCQPNSQYDLLLKYLQSEEWTRKGRTKVDTLVGKKICNYCYQKMQSDEIPRTSIRNNMDEGIVPKVIADLTPFEAMFIRQVSMFQSFLKLGPSVGNRPNNEKMSAVKGFSVHIPVPVEMTIKQLAGDNHQLVNPRSFIVLHGIPRKDKNVWQSLINVERIVTALKWLVKNNPHYKDIHVPSKDEILDMLCENDSDVDNSPFSTDFDDSWDEPQSSKSLSSSSNSSTKPPAKKPCQNFTHTAKDCKSPKGDDPCNIKKDSSANFDDSLRETLCELADEIDISESSSDNSSPPFYWKRSKRRSSTAVSDAEMASCEGSHSSDESEISFASNAGVIGGKNSSSSVEVDQVNIGEMELGIKDEDPSFKSLWRFSATVTELEMARIKEMSSLNSRKKKIAIRCVIHMARMLQCNGSLCRLCQKGIKQYREMLVALLQKSNTTLGYQLLDVRVLIVALNKVRVALIREESSIDSNRCSLCTENKISLKPFALSLKTRRRYNRSRNRSLNNHEQIANFSTKFFLNTRIKVLTILDNLQESVKICHGCRDEMETSCRKSISHHTLPSRSLTMKIQKRATALYDVFCEAQGLQAKANIEEAVPGNDQQNCGICVKCDSIISINRDLIDRQFEDIEEQTADSRENESEQTLQVDHSEMLGVKNAASTELTSETFQVCQMSTEDKSKNKSVNSFYCRAILHNLDIALLRSLHCHGCKRKIKSTASAFKKLYKSPSLKHSYINLEHCDTQILKSLNTFYYERGSASFALQQCFVCENSLDLVGGGPASDVLSSDFTSVSESEAEAEVRQGEEKEQKDGETATKEDPEQKDPKKMIEEMTADDYKNLVEEYTITGTDILDENPELMDDLYKLLRIDGDPVDMSDTKLDLLAFPEIFSWGVGGKRGFRGEEAKPLQYEKCRLMSCNGATRRHVQHLFHLAGECERRKIRSSIFATLKNVQDIGNLDTASLLNKIKTKDSALMRRINKVLRLVPNTQAYWESQRAKLKAQIEKFGPPTFFITFSPAEYDWEDLVQHLKEVNNDIPNVDDLSTSALLNKDPVLTSVYIHKRFDALLKFILDAEPLGKVKSYFVRHEYQSRGTIHFHCFFWIDGAPVIGKSSDEEISSFVQRHITCRLPDPVRESSLLNVVNSYQLHKCRPYCLRKFRSKNASKVKRQSDLGNKTDSNVACRFGFPRPKSKKFVLNEVLTSVVARKAKKMRKRLYDLPRSEDERRVNDYNSILSFLWSGNMDIQFLAEDTHCITEYVTKYITKSETSVIDMNDADLKDLSKTSYQNLSKFAFQLLKSREMGAHEAADRILQNNGELWRSSETFVWVPTTTPNKRTRVMRNLKDLEGQRPDSKKIFYDDWVHVFYPNRPRTSEFDNMSLSDFVSQFEKVTGKPNMKKEKDAHRKYIKIQDEHGNYIRTLQRRKKTPVIYHHNYSLRTEPELFYYSMMALYKPWRKEEDIVGQHESYSESFFDSIKHHTQLKEMASRKINIEKAKEKMESEAKARMADSGNCDPSQEDDDPIAEDDPNLRTGLKEYIASNDKSEIRSVGDLNDFVETLNEDQKRVYDKVTNHVEHMLMHRDDQCDGEGCSRPLFLYISGFGGTGKSYLIKALQGYLWVQKCIKGKLSDIALTAPTGLAATNIGGLTLHSLFNLPVEHGQKLPKYSALKQHSLQQTRNVMKKLSLVVIDEISMVSAQMLMSVNLRMQEIFGAHELFGGKCVVVFGDLLQLPPVHGKRPFEEMTGEDVHELTGGLKIPSHLWENFEYDELTINQRQKGHENNKWSAMLGRIRIGRQTQEDVKILRERLIPVRDCGLPRENLEQIVHYYLNLQNEYPSTVCLLPKRAMMDAFNACVMKILFPRANEVVAADEVDGKTKADKKRALEAVQKIDKLGDSRNTADLEKLLMLCEGVRIMLRKNLDTTRGLVNGAMGTVRKLVRLSDNQKAPVEYLIVQFDGVEGDVKISRETRKVKVFENSFLHRRQFPISTGYALTIHKAQGMSLSHVFCDLGKSVFATGQIYVALSRCKSLQGLYLVNLDEANIKVDPLAINEYIKLKSKPIREAGISSMADVQADATKKRKKKYSSSATERIWYETDAFKKAKKTVKENLGDSAKPSNTKAKKRVPKKKEKAKKTEPANPFGVNSRRLTTGNVNEFINLVHESVPAEHVPTQDIVTGFAVRDIYKRVLVPAYRSETTSDSRNFFIRAAALELDPNPFDERRESTLWLHGETIQKYLWVLKDDMAEIGGPTIYNMGPYCQTYSTSSRGRYNHGSIESFTKTTFAERPFTRLRGFKVLPFNRTDYIIKCGDPLEHELIAMVGNTGSHWYAVVIDNRTRQIVHYDSMVCSPSIMENRCRVHQRLIRDFRIYIRSTYRIPIDDTLSTEGYSFIDGNSHLQTNSYDCGVFSLMNIEKYMTNRPSYHPIAQPLMKLYRLRILNRLYHQSVDLGLAE
ncbi:hypothetical protein ACHWQZ_G000453 [Mnemiopsis leidyi]